MSAQPELPAAAEPPPENLAPSQVDRHETVDYLSRAADDVIKSTVDSGAANSATAAELTLPAIPGYEILERLGQGGMGEVLKAREAALQRLVAIKLPLPHRLDSPQHRANFVREARAAAGLRHPNICPIYKVDQVEGRPFIVMAYIHGETLDRWIHERQPSARQCADLLAVLARAVEYAHQHQVIHRDIKPVNVMVDAESQQPVLMDFGLAKDIADDVHMTQEGQVLGTPAYMAPEQAAGRIDQVGPLSDVYALGAVLYQMLCKRAPFRGSFGEVIKQVQTDEPPLPRTLAPTIHRDLETICLKALAKNAGDRYSSALALAEDLERFSAGEAIQARREGYFAKVRRKIRKNRVLAAALVLLVVAVATLAMVVERTGRQSRVQEIEDRLRAEVETWTPDTLAEREALLDELAASAPEKSDPWRQRLHQMIHQSGLARVQKTSLQPDDHVYLDSVVAWLRPRDASLADNLEQEHRSRARRWDKILELAAPFAERDQLFRLSDRVSIQDGTLRLRPAAPLFLCNVPAQANLWLEATWDATWDHGTHSALGLAINATSGSEKSGYVFVLRAAGESDKKLGPPTFETVRKQGGHFLLQIYRGGVRLRERTVAPSELAAGPLRMEAKRDGSRLIFQVDPLPPLEFEDLFPVGNAGDAGILWPHSAAITKLQAWRRALPAKPSDLEQGDELFATRRLAEARSYYQEQARRAAGTDVAFEARYKEGLTHLELKDVREADRVFLDLALQQGKRWPLLAACQHWFLLVQQKQYDDAEKWIDGLALRHQVGVAQALATHIPQEARDAILAAYSDVGGGISFWQPDPQRLRKVERLAQVQRLLDPDSQYLNWTVLRLVRTYRLEGFREKAMHEVRAVLDKEPLESPFIPLFVNEYGWICRELGKADHVEPEITPRLEVKPGVYRPALTPLLLERARMHAALERWPEARKDLEDFLRLAPPGDLHHRNHSDACLMLGLVRDRLGDRAGALDAWRRGIFKNNPLDPTINLGLVGGGIGFMNIVMLQSLAGALDEPFVEGWIRHAVSAVNLPLSGPVDLLKPEIKTLTRAGQTMWTTPRGRQRAQQMAFQTIPFADYLRTLPLEFTIELGRHEVFGPTMTPEQEDWLLRLSERALQDYMTGKIQLPDRLSLVLLAYPVQKFWRHGENMWKNFDNRLPKEYRAPAAYLMAQRCLRLQKTVEARQLLRVALDQPNVDASVARWAREDLQRLAPK